MEIIEKNFNEKDYFSSITRKLSDGKPKKTNYAGLVLSSDPFLTPDLEGVKLFAEAVIGKKRVAFVMSFAPFLGLVFRETDKRFKESDLLRKMVSTNLAGNIENARAILYSLRGKDHQTYGYGVKLRILYEEIAGRETKYAIGISTAPPLI